VKTLVLGLGNELLSDDAIGIVVARALRDRIPAEPGGVDVVESSLAGLALLDLFFGYDRAVVVDGIRTGRRPPGEVIELTPADLDSVVAPSPHYAGLPELLAVARNLGLPFPTDVRILAVETEDPYTIGGTLSEPVRGAVEGVVERVRGILETPHA
jgi:hydrogenase maturation protease